MRIIQVEPQDALPQLEHVYDGLLVHLLQLAGDKELTLPAMRAQAWRESAFNPLAISATGCRGLFQFSRAAWQDMDDDPATVEDRFDLFLNAHRAVKLMSAHIVRYRSFDIIPPERWKFALAAFNQGARNVSKARMLAQAQGKDSKLWLDVHPFFDQVLEAERALEVKVYVRTIANKRAEYEVGLPA